MICLNCEIKVNSPSCFSCSAGITYSVVIVYCYSEQTSQMTHRAVLGVKGPTC